jgi:hypothetical protein
MQNKRLRSYLAHKEAKKNERTNKESVQANPDKHIDQDFSGFPHSPSKEEIISPKTKEEKKIAAVDTKDGEKVIDPPAKKKALKKQDDEINSDGSANAFEGTESFRDDE